MKVPAGSPRKRGSSAATGESTRPAERGTASAAYSFMRFSGAAVAPWLAGVLGEQVSVHLPYWVGAGAVLLGAGVLFATRGHLSGVDAEESEIEELADEATALTVGSDT